MPLKKKITKAKTTKTKRTIPQTRSSSAFVPFSVTRIVIFSACLMLVFVAAVVTIKRHTLSQAVAGTSIVRGFYEQATIPLPAVTNAVTYNIYYKTADEATFTNAARDIPSDIHYYTLSYLKKGVQYKYKYAAVDNLGKEFFFSDVSPITDLKPM